MEDCGQKPASRGQRIVHDLGFFGRFLHLNGCGRFGKQKILTSLFASGGQLSQRTLQERSNISAAALSEVLSKLEAEQLVTRTRSAEDRRQMDIALTEQGRLRAEQLRSESEAFESACLACLTEAEQEELLSLLDRLAEHWKGMRGEGACA